MSDCSKRNKLQTMTSLKERSVRISSYFPGYDIFCPKCNSNRTVIFFDLKMLSRLTREWKEKINERKFVLSNQWEIILEHTPKNNITSYSNPNWVCKKCFDGGVVIDER